MVKSENILTLGSVKFYRENTRRPLFLFLNKNINKSEPPKQHAIKPNNPILH